MEKRFRVTSLFLVILIAITTLYHPYTVKAAEVIEGFHGGSGTKDDPYQISTVEEFEILRGNLKVDDGYDHADYYAFSLAAIYLQYLMIVPNRFVRRSLD